MHYKQDKQSWESSWNTKEKQKEKEGSKIKGLMEVLTEYGMKGKEALLLGFLTEAYCNLAYSSHHLKARQRYGVG